MKNVQLRSQDILLKQRLRCGRRTKKFGISKSTVHKDCVERLKVINPALAIEVRKVLDVNKQERHIRGGIATREKYLHAHMR